MKPESNPATMNKITFEQLHSQDARMESIIYLAGMATVTYAVPQVLDELIEDASYKELEELFGIPQKEAQECSEDFGSEMLREAIIERLHLCNRLGFLLQIATPVMTRMPGMRGRGYSWGCYATKWVYGETLDDAIEEGLKFVAQQRAREDEEFEKQQAAVSNG